MPSNRRDFIKIFGAGSITLLTNSEMNYTPLLKIKNQQNASPAESFTVQELKTDILVAGGGLAGVCAALAAARNGAEVILVQDRSRLGGNSSSEIRMHVLGANNHTKTRNWRETGIIEELKLTEAATNPQRSFGIWDLILYDKVVSEKNILLMLDTSVIAAEVKSNRIVKASAISPLLEEYYEIEADYFIDCTGDATLAAVAGAKIMRGREGQDVFGESLAPEKSDHKTMGNSILFFAKKHDQPMPFKKPAWARTFTSADFKHRSIHAYEYGYWWIEWGGELDTIKDNRKIRHELLRVVLGVWDYIKNSGDHPDSVNWALDWISMIPGKRESRRIVGEHIMIQQELERAELYPDRVAYGGWPLDDHPPCGIDCTDQSPYRSIKLGKPYNIPLRSLYSVNIHNLLMAGRNISASHVAFSSSRVMATCATMGQAAGTAAAFCVRHNCLPGGLVHDDRRLTVLQQLLLKNDQAMLGIRNEDPDDLARSAIITASTETADGKAITVIDGWNRHIEDGLVHQWQAPMNNENPWLQLDWETIQSISEIQITFDSGLNRKLFLSGQNSEYKSQIRGPQPETVADYIIFAKQNDVFLPIVNRKDNFLRLVRHRLETIQTQAIRIQIHRTNGDQLARIFEVRCYH